MLHQRKRALSFYRDDSIKAPFRAHNNRKSIEKNPLFLASKFMAHFSSLYFATESEQSFVTNITDFSLNTNLHELTTNYS